MMDEEITRVEAMDELRRRIVALFNAGCEIEDLKTKTKFEKTVLEFLKDLRQLVEDGGKLGRKVKKSRKKATREG